MNLLKVNIFFKNFRRTRPKIDQNSLDFWEFSAHLCTRIARDSWLLYTKQGLTFNVMS